MTFEEWLRLRGYAVGDPPAEDRGVIDSADWGGVRDQLGATIESIDVLAKPCDDCGVTGQTKLFVDMHVFKLCPACAWKLTDEYHAMGYQAPWEGKSA